MPRSAASTLLAISQWLFLGVIFLVPVIALPWTTDAFETNKQAVFVTGITLSAASYMVSMLLDRRSMSLPGILTIVPFLLLIATCLSAAFSLAPMTSWIGQGAQEYVSVLSLVGFVTLFLLAKEFGRDSRMVRNLLISLFMSSALVSLALVPIFLGDGSGVFTNLIGAPHACAIYLLGMSILACGLWLAGFKLESRGWQRLLTLTAVITFAACLMVLLAVDSPVLWVLALVGSGTLFGIALLHADKFQDPLRFTPSMLIFVLSIIFFILPTRFPSPFLQEVSPSLQTTWNVINGAWNEGSIVLGTGPGTFSLMYSKYTSLSVNESDFWELVFDRGNSFVTTQLATIGILGVFTWLFFAILLLVLAMKKIAATEAGWREVLPVFVAWFLMVVGTFVYAQNITLAMQFWVFSGTLAGLLVPRFENAGSNLARARLATVLATVVVLVCAITTIFVTAPRYSAEVAFAKAVKINASTDTAQEVDEMIRLLDKAASTNPWNDTYYRNLAGAVLRRISLLSSDEASNDEYVQSLITTAIAAATKATDVSPANVMNWDVRGMVYRELLPVVPDAAQPSVDAYEKAIELSPVNPRYRVEVARAYLSIADAQTPFLQNEDKDVVAQAEAAKDMSIAKAEEHLTTAIALKGDYALAHYYLALLKQRQGELAEAVRGLEFVVAQAPTDVGVGLQLGLLYLRQGKNELAQAELQRVIELVPAYANAHWYLSVVFEQVGDLKSAIAEVEKVLMTNPDNVTVQTRLERLQVGQTSDVIPDPISLIAP